MLCHKCPHQKEIDRLRKICCACSGVSDKPFADHRAGNRRRIISIDAMQDAGGIVGRHYARADVGPSGEKVTTLPTDVEMRLRDELASFMRLSFMNQLLLVWLMRGESAAEFARLDWLPKAGRDNGMLTRQAVNERITTLKRTCPGIAEAIAQMVKLNSGNRGKEKRRKKRG